MGSLCFAGRRARVRRVRGDVKVGSRRSSRCSRRRPRRWFLGVSRLSARPPLLSWGVRPQRGFLMAKEYPLIVGSQELIPDKELARMAAALEVALSTSGVGAVGARATFVEPKFWHLRSIIHVTVSDLEAGVEVLCRTLRSVDAPMATWVWQGDPPGRAETIYEVWNEDDE